MKGLTDKEREFLTRLAMGVPLALADRPEDRARQRCRRAGFAEVLMRPRRWVITEAGRQALQGSGE